MRKVGDYWVPRSDMRWGHNRKHTLKSFGEGRRGTQIHHLEGALAHLRTQGGVAIDAGANVGAYTRLLAERFESVHAFELGGEVVACLARNVAEWGVGDRVVVHACAVSDRRESVGASGPEGGRSISLRVTPGGPIAAMPLDGLGLADGTAPLTFLKLDVEGYEEKALHGAEATITAHRPLVMMEVDREHAERYGDGWAAHDWLCERGYRVIDKLGKRHLDWVYAHATTHGDLADLGREALPPAS